MGRFSICIVANCHRYAITIAEIENEVVERAFTRIRNIIENAGFLRRIVFAFLLLKNYNAKVSSINVI